MDKKDIQEEEKDFLDLGIKATSKIIQELMGLIDNEMYMKHLPGLGGGSIAFDGQFDREGRVHTFLEATLRDGKRISLDGFYSFGAQDRQTICEIQLSVANKPIGNCVVSWKSEHPDDRQWSYVLPDSSSLCLGELANALRLALDELPQLSPSELQAITSINPQLKCTDILGRSVSEVLKIADKETQKQGKPPLLQQENILDGEASNYGGAGRGLIHLADGSKLGVIVNYQAPQPESEEPEFILFINFVSPGQEGVIAVGKWQGMKGEGEHTWIFVDGQGVEMSPGEFAICLLELRIEEPKLKPRVSHTQSHDSPEL